MDYTKYALKVKAKIERYGGKCTIERKDELVYNPSTDEYEGTTDKINGMALLSNYDNSAVNGTSILAGDVNLMCYLDGEPKVNDVLSFGGKEYSIVNINALNPNGDKVIYYDIQAR